MLLKGTNRQRKMEFVYIEDLVPKDHILRKIDKYINFSFINDLCRPYYCENNGRPAIEPEIMFKMLFIGYLFGIRSETRLVEDVKPYRERLEYQIGKFGFKVETVGLDAGYNTSAICKMLLEDFKIQAAMGKRRGCQQKGKYGKYKFKYIPDWDVQERQFKQKELHILNARNDELDNLFEHIYEDNVSGKISDDRFAKLSVKYESEQKEITARIKDLETELDTEKSKAVTADMFMASVRKYTRARKLTPRMLNELIEKIEVHQSEKIDGKTVQQLTIHYNCIGNIEIPDLEKLPENNVSVHTRQGVDVHFAACAS